MVNLKGEYEKVYQRSRDTLTLILYQGNPDKPTNTRSVPIKSNLDTFNYLSIKEREK